MGYNVNCQFISDSVSCKHKGHRWLWGLMYGNCVAYPPNAKDSCPDQKKWPRPVMKPGSITTRGANV